MEGEHLLHLFAGEETERDCQQNKVKGRKRQRKDRSSSVSPASPEVKVQKLEEGDGVESEIDLGEDPMEVESGRGLPTKGYWSHYQSLCNALPGRERQIEELLTLFGEVRRPSLKSPFTICLLCSLLQETSFLPPSIYLYGNSGTGKTHTLQTMINTLQVSRLTS